MGAFNHNIRAWRELLKERSKENVKELTQEKFAEMLGIKRSRLTAYERGRTAPYEFLVYLHQEHGVDLTKFLCQEMTNSNFDDFFAVKSSELQHSIKKEKGLNKEEKVPNSIDWSEKMIEEQLYILITAESEREREKIGKGLKAIIFNTINEMRSDMNDVLDMLKAKYKR